MKGTIKEIEKVKTDKSGEIWNLIKEQHVKTKNPTLFLIQRSSASTTNPDFHSVTRFDPTTQQAFVILDCTSKYRLD